MFFGQKLKELRLKYLQIEKEDFAKKIGMDFLDYCHVENGFLEPPEEFSWIKTIIEKLNLKREDEMQLLDLWSKPFIMQKK
jgi:predicted transcriptional regulator